VEGLLLKTVKTQKTELLLFGLDVADAEDWRALCGDFYAVIKRTLGGLFCFFS